MERGHRPLTPAFALQNAHHFHDYDYTTKEPRTRDPLMDRPMAIPSSLLTYDAVVAAANSSTIPSSTIPSSIIPSSTIPSSTIPSSTITSSAAPFSSASDHPVDDMDTENREVADWALGPEARTLEQDPADDLINEIREIANYRLH